MRGLVFVVGSCLALGASASNPERRGEEPCSTPTATRSTDATRGTTTTTIPYIGTCTTSTTITPCIGPVTVVIETPLVTPVCQPTSTSTYTPIKSATPTPIPSGACHLINPFCAPAGFNIDSYPNAFAGYSSGNVPPSYYFTEGLSPLASSLTNETFFPQTVDPTGLKSIFPDPSLPNAPYFVGWTRETNGGVSVDANNFTVVYQGFYRAPATGTFELCATADNEDAVFFGAGNAFDCLDGKPSASASPVVITTGAGFINGINCTNVDLVKGFYYPVRNVMGNWQGPSAFNFTIDAPGVPFPDRTNNFAGNAYPHDCGIYL